MKPVIQMTAEELRDEFLKLEAEGGIDGAFSPDDQARWNAVHVEFVRRATELEDAKEDHREERVQRFATSATIAVCGLWKAHGGREMSDDEAAAYAKLMFEFFLTVR